MAANGNNNRRIIRGVYTGNEIPEFLRRDVPALGIVEGEVTLPEITLLEVARSITAIPGTVRFWAHPNLVVLVCHANVKKIESNGGTKTFSWCTRLRRVVLRGVEEVGGGAFEFCYSLVNVECNKLEIIGEFAFGYCEALPTINLPSARIVEAAAFVSCKAMEAVTFGPLLESIEGKAFYDCPSLEQITIPLKNDLFPDDCTFQACHNLRQVFLVDDGVLEETVAALLLEDWRDDMIDAIDSINHSLSNTSAGDLFIEGEKTIVIRHWISSVLSKVIYYKAQHRRLLDEVVTPTLQYVETNDIVLDNVLPFLELPFHTFHGE